MKVIHFDQILSNRVKLGAYQYQAFAILSLIDFIDGFQEILSSILLAILTLEFNLTQFQQSLLTSIYFIGIVIGNFISALASDKLGRRILLIYG